MADVQAMGGPSPVSEFLAGLPTAYFAQVYSAMSAVAVEGLIEARHLRGAIYEVWAGADGRRSLLSSAENT